MEKQSLLQKMGKYAFMWVGVGLSLGAGMGVVMDDIPKWAGIGMVLGAGISTSIYLASRRQQSGDDQ
jgi:hypothetical protein